MGVWSKEEAADFAPRPDLEITDRHANFLDLPSNAESLERFGLLQELDTLEEDQVDHMLLLLWSECCPSLNW